MLVMKYRFAASPSLPVFEMPQRAERRGRGACRAARFAFACAALVLAALAVQPAKAEAYDNDRGPNAVAYVSCKGSNPRGYYCNSYKDMFNCTADMLSGTNNPYQVDTVTIDVLCDWNTKDYGHLVFDDDDCTYLLNLHGHMIDRGLTTADTKFYGTGNGDVIRIKGKTTVIIDGGTTEELQSVHYGKLVDDGYGGKFWKYDANADTNDESTLAIMGALITGGADDDDGYGGGISVGGGSAGLSMTNVTVAGNVTDNYGALTPQGTGTRYGAGLHVYGAAMLTGCKVIYNHSESSGGGISCSAMSETSFTVLDNTEVSYNTSRNDGGGIWNDSANSTSIMLRNGSKVSHNISVRYGGGIFCYTRGTGTFELGQNTEVSYNISKGTADENEGGGGGICFQQDASDASKLTVIVGDGVNIHHNEAQESSYGGGILFDVPTYPSSLFRVKGAWTVSDNKGSRGGGIAQCYSTKSSLVSQSLDYGNITLTNNEATGSGAGIYKQGTGTDSFGSDSVIKGNKAGGSGGFYCNNYGGGSIKFPDGGLTIADNSAGYYGGAISAFTASDFTLICSTGGMKFINNTSKMSGGAIYASRRDNSDPDATPDYCGTKLDIFGDTTTEFTNNTAADRGGAIMLSCETDRTTHISNATFTGNAAGKGGTEGYGGAIFFRNELYLKNTSITGNTATKGGGGIYCYNTDYYNFEFAGKMTVTGNSLMTYEDDGTAVLNATNNLEMRGEQDVCSAATEADAVTPESKIGVTVSDYSSGKRRLTGNSAFVTLAVKDSWKSCVVSDIPQYEVVRDGDYLYLAQGSTESELRAYGADESTPQTTGTYKAGEEVELKSSDYPKSTVSNGQTYNWALDYWTVSCEATGSFKVVMPDENGIATITMGSDVTVARAHYTAPLTYLFLGVADSDSWDNLKTKSGDAAMSAAYAHYAQFDDADGKRSTFTFAMDETPFAVIGRSVTDNVDSDGSGYVTSKNITYTITMPVSAATEKGLVVDRDALKKFALEATFSAMGGSKESGVGSLSVNNDDTVTFTCTVTKANPTKKRCTVTFDANGGVLSTADATRIVSANEKIGNLPTPTFEGHTFEGWFIKDTGVKVTEDTTVVSNLELVAKWSEDDKPVEYVTVTCKDGDTELGSFQIEKGSSLTDPVHPTKTGYTFKGWKRSADASECVTFPLENVTENLTLYADWKIDSCMVTFDLAGGTLDGKTTVDDKTVNYGDKLANPGTPTKDGFEFAGWYNGVDKYEFGESVTSDLSLIAVWKEKAVSTLEVSFDLNGADGDAPATQPVAKGGYATTPDDPAWAGHVFKGWYTDKECSDDKKFNFATTPIDVDTKLYAKWAKTYTVTFVFNNGTDGKETRVVEEGEELSELPRPTYEGHTFSGWYYTNAAGDLEEVDKDYRPTSDMELVAEWKEKGDDGGETTYYLVSFDSDGGTSVSSQKVKSGNTATEPKDPSKDGFTFKGWQLDGEDYDFDAAVTGDITLKAVWQEKEPDPEPDPDEKIEVRMVTFDSDGGSAVKAQKVVGGESATEPKDPSKDGFTFKGWQLDGEDYDFDAAVTGDITLKAVWQEKEPDPEPDPDEKIEVRMVTFDSDGGSAVKAQKVVGGESATEPKDPSKDGFTFKGWQLDGEDYDFDAAVTGDITLKAVWQEKGADGGTTPGGGTTPNNGTTSDDAKGNADASGGSSTTVVTETKKATANGDTQLAGTGDYTMLSVCAVLVVGIAAAAVGVVKRRCK